jgi:hypothetical protein
LSIESPIRPHQSLNNFTPAHVHEVHNKGRPLAELQEIKRNTREKRKACWTEQRKRKPTRCEGGCLDKGEREIVNPAAKTEAVLQQTGSLLIRISSAPL